MRIDFWKNWFEPKPFNFGYLPETDGHRVYFEEYGNPKGKPIVVLHGGPGGSFRSKHIQFADLRRYRVIGFDQRGCRRSLPLGETCYNTTADLLKDIERLLDYLQIREKIILRGASWGATLALLYAEMHPEKVEKLLLSQVFLADEDANNWEFEGLKHFYPEFVEDMQEKAKKQDIRTFFAAEICSDDKNKQLDAVNHYGIYERLCDSLLPQWGSCEAIDEGELASQRIYMTYAKEKFMLSKQQILDNIDKIRNIPAVIVHNRLDFVCPLKGAYDVYKALRYSKLVVVPDKGHVSSLLSKTINRVFREEVAL